MRANGYVDWALVNPPPRPAHPRNTENRDPQPTVAVPYIRNMSEELARAYHRHGVNTYMKPINTLRSQLVKPKDRTPVERQSGVVYRIVCDQDQSHVYIGETKRTVATRFAEHNKQSDQPTAVREHITATGHSFHKFGQCSDSCQGRTNLSSKNQGGYKHQDPTSSSQPRPRRPAAPDLRQHPDF